METSGHHNSYVSFIHACPAQLLEDHGHSVRTEAHPVIDCDSDRVTRTDLFGERRQSKWLTDSTKYCCSDVVQRRRYMLGREGFDDERSIRYFDVPMRIEPVLQTTNSFHGAECSWQAPDTASRLTNIGVC